MYPHTAMFAASFDHITNQICFYVFPPGGTKVGHNFDESPKADALLDALPEPV